jgi:hypothetical protein
MQVDEPSSPKPPEAVIDACVFHEWTSVHDLAPYLSSGWQEELIRPGDRTGAIKPLAPALYIDPRGAKAPDAFPPEGPAGAQYELLAAQVLEDGQRDRVVLGYDDGLLATAWMMPEAGRAVARAANDWTIEHWLERDDRLFGLALVSSENPADAAAEIRRSGRDPRIVGIEIGANKLGLPFGHATYDPIYEAACELGLPIVIESSTDLAGTLNAQPMAGGLAATYAEYRALGFQPGMAHVTSMVILGTFERFPQLKVLLNGTGASWMPGLVWKMDFFYKMDHSELPWLKRFPSEYFRDHVRVTTNALETTDPPDRIVRALETLPWFPEILLYGSAYPNAGWEQPQDVGARLPDAWRENVYRQNALAFFGWPDTETPSLRSGALAADDGRAT